MNQVTNRQQEEIFETYVESKTVEEESIKIATKDSENIEATNVSPRAAFEYFQGKIYDTSHIYSVADRIERRVESPFQRFIRLKMELSELESDISVMMENKEKETEELSVWDTLQAETRVLISNLGSASTKLDTLYHSVDKDTSYETTVTANKQITENGRKENNLENIMLSKNDSAVDMVLLEKRIFALECLLGSASNTLDMESVTQGHVASGGWTKGLPLVDVVLNMEKRLSYLDESNLDSLRSKSMLLRGDLEELLKEKNKVTSTGSNAAKILEAASKVDILYEKAAQIGTFAQDLPELVLRLKTLESVHLQAAGVTARLGSLEKAAEEMNELYATNEELLQSLKEGFASNMKTIHENIALIDNRIDQMSSK